jgi:hypothetical protein
MVESEHRGNESSNDIYGLVTITMSTYGETFKRQVVEQTGVHL